MNNDSENSTVLTDRQLLELVLKEINGVKDEQKLMKDTMNMHFENFNQRLLQLEVLNDTLTSLAHQALSVAHAVKADVRALREESASHGRDISELQKKLLLVA